MLVETDYLVVGAGATGLAFADTLVAEADVDVTVVDRRPAPGGHWVDAYPFVRLHTPSAFYGVDSLALGADRIDETGENAGFYERASGEEVVGYFAAVAERLEATGRARVMTGHEFLGDAGGDGAQVRDLDSGAVRDLLVRRKVVDARYLESSIPATHTVPFEVEPTVRFVPVNELPAAAGSASSYTVLGAGKTATDACVWLLDHDVEPDRIRWVRPRDMLFYDRRHFQPLDQVGAIMEGIADDAATAAKATTLEELSELLEASGRLRRIDDSYPATMFRGTMLSDVELDSLRQVEDVVRMGRVRRIEAGRVVLDRGEIDSDVDTLFVDCTALGLNNAPATDVFQGDRIVLQQVRHLSPCFNAAVIAFLEAHREDDAERNRLCPPNPYPSGIEDWPRMISRTWRSERRWLSEPDLTGWVAGSRLNLLRSLPEHAGAPEVQDEITRFLSNVGPAIESMKKIDEAG